MSKIKTISYFYKIGGLLGVVKAIRSAINNRQNKLKSEWPIRALINSDLVDFARTYGYMFDIRKPESFTEKVHTYKLLYNDPTMSEIVDKYTFKDFVRRRLGSNKYVANSYGIYDSIEQIEKDWDNLPNEFVLKSTISSDGNNIIFIENRTKTSFESIRDDIKKCFDPRHTQLSGYARAYYSLKPRVLAEEYIHELDGGNLIDYKFYCFNGHVEFVYTTSRLFESKENPSDANYPRTFFNTKWEKLDISLGNHPTAENIQRPQHFDDMLKIAKELSTGYPFVRVDFYDTEETPLLGEMTFYPTGGWKTLSPIEFDRQLGDLFVIPTENLIRF